MTRSNAREILLHLVFERNVAHVPASTLLEAHFVADYYKTLAQENEAYACEPDPKQLAYIDATLRGIEVHEEELDEQIRKNAVSWSLNRISKVTRSVLQLALYEMRYVEDVPVATAINEAVELTKKYDSEDAAPFVNGILGAVSRQEA